MGTPTIESFIFTHINPKESRGASPVVEVVEVVVLLFVSVVVVVVVVVVVLLFVFVFALLLLLFSYDPLPDEIDG